MRAPPISFVILTRDRQPHVLGCVESVLDQDCPGAEVVVVDNASSDGTVEAVRNRWAGVRVVACASNAGVSGGRNRGLEAARAEVCVLIDDDARLPDRGAARRALAVLERHPGAACLAFRIVRGDTGCDDRKSIPLAARHAPQIETAVAGFCGAGFAIRRTVALRLGGFWEPLGYAGEELDLSYRLIAAGHGILYVPSVAVHHAEALEARPPGRWVYHQARNRPWIAARHLPWRYVWTTSMLWWGYTALLAARDRQWRSWFFGVRDAVRGLPAARSGRRRWSKTAMDEVRRLSGRLWY